MRIVIEIDDVGGPAVRVDTAATSDAAAPAIDAGPAGGSAPGVAAATSEVVDAGPAPGL